MISPVKALLRPYFLGGGIGGVPLDSHDQKKTWKSDPFYFKKPTKKNKPLECSSTHNLDIKKKYLATHNNHRAPKKITKLSN